MKRHHGVFVVIVVFFLFGMVYADDPPFDPYYTMGITRGDNPDLNKVSESVDPFSGYLSLVHTDLTLPGNGGMDVSVIRTYNSCIWGRKDVSNPGLIAVNERSPLGLGWSMHMGVVRNPAGTGSSNRYLPDNPVFEMPDGSHHVFYKDKNDTTRFISSDFMVYKLRSSGIWDLTLTDGTVYTFQYNTVAGYDTLDSVKVAQATQIKNPAGTSVITITYTKSNGYSFLNTITDSVGRTIQFAYDTSGRLSTVKTDTRTITYTYQTISTTVGTKSVLAKTALPAGNAWNYAYYTTSGTYDLKSITFPAGGSITYEYGNQLFNTGMVNVSFRVVTKRTTGGRIANAGSWSYAYSSGGSTGDVTTVTGPGGLKEVYKNNGWGNCRTGSVWLLGLPISKETYLSNTLIEKEAHTWIKGTLVSNDDKANAGWSGTGGQVYDDYIYAPFQGSIAITRDGRTSTTTFASQDTYGNPKTITETGNKTRTTAKTYWYNTSLNIVHGKPATESITVSGLSGTISNSYTYSSSTGALTKSVIRGVTTDYTYYTNGNVNTVKDANSKTRTYVWTNGRVSKVTNPEYSESRVINTNGTVTSETNGRNYKTSYTYDGNLRITSITPPVGNKTTITYASDGSYERETRGNFYTDYYKDGFGRSTGTKDRVGVTTSIYYTSYGAMDYSSLNIGDSTYYDLFGRIKSIVHRDSTTVTYTYASGNVSVKDEDNKTTVLSNQCFGNPDDQWLVQVTDADTRITTYGYNTAGMLTSIVQNLSSGSVNRSYVYDTKYFLTSESHPEKGTVSYGRDNVGNMTSKTDALGQSTYTYDGVYRLTKITNGSNVVNFTYDQAGNRTAMSNVAGSATCVYDSADRLTSMTETILGKPYTTGYTYNANDLVTHVIYPSGRDVVYAFNDNNQVTSVTGFGGSVSAISYFTSGQNIGFPSQHTLSNGLKQQFTYNSRNLVTRVASGLSSESDPSSRLDMRYGFDTRGNTLTLTNALNSSENQTLTYDVLNRLKTFNGPWGSGSFSYDTTGNRLTKIVGASSSSYTYSNNRLSSVTGSEAMAYSYNTNGDMTAMGTYSFTYDVYHNMLSSKQGSTTLATYTYNGDNLRISKTAGGTTTVYHLDPGGNILSETDSAGVLMADYIYLHGKLIARVENTVTAAASVMTLAAVAMDASAPKTQDELLQTSGPGEGHSILVIGGGQVKPEHEHQTGVSMTPILVSGLTLVQDNVRWQVGTGPDFNGLVLDVTSDKGRSSITVPDLVLDGMTTYYCRLKQESDAVWSGVLPFTTQALPWDDENANGVPDDQEADLPLPVVFKNTPVKSVYAPDGREAMGIFGINRVEDVELAVSIDPETLEDGEGKPADMILGLLGFRLVTVNAGDTVRVGILLSQSADSRWTWYAYDAVSGWSDRSDLVTRDNRTVVLTLTDGGDGDADGCANGVIVSAFGPGTGK